MRAEAENAISGTKSPIFWRICGRPIYPEIAYSLSLLERETGSTRPFESQPSRNGEIMGRWSQQLLAFTPSLLVLGK